MTIKMADGSEKTSGNDSPTYIITSPPSSEARESSNGSIQKKHVLIGVSFVVVTGLVIAAILIGMHMFTQGHKDIVKYSTNFKSSSDGEDVNQDVEADPNDNVVKYHVTKNGQDVTIVNDFNRDLQVVKLSTADDTNCYVSPLNRSASLDPSHVNELESKNGDKGRQQEMFSVSSTPVADRSFLPKKAIDMCKGVSVYWAYRSCQGQQADPSAMNQTKSDDRQRRAIYLMNKQHGMYGLGGCCLAVWACQVDITETIQGGIHRCNIYYRAGTCCGVIAAPYCNNVYYAKWQTPGMTCLTSSV